MEYKGVIEKNVVYIQDKSYYYNQCMYKQLGCKKYLPYTIKDKSIYKYMQVKKI